jgi:hypothetical protein
MLAQPQDAAGWSHQPQELVMTDAVLLAEAKDHANWSCVAGVVDQPGLR